MILENILNKFKTYPWWKKALLFVPFLLAVIVVALFVTNKDSVSNDKLVSHSKGKTDKEIDDFAKSMKSLKKQRKEIAKKREEIRKELTDAKDDYISVANDIDNADSNNLDVVAQKLRADAANNRHGS